MVDLTIHASVEGGRRRKILCILSSVHLVNDVFFYIIPSILPLIVEFLGISYLEAGLLITSTRFAPAVLQPLLGHFAERRGVRKMTIVLGLLVLGSAITLLTLSTSYLMFTVTAVLIGLGLSTYHPQGIATISEYYESNRGFILGIHGAVGELGVALGPLLVGLLLSTVGWAEGLRFTFLFTLILAVFVWRTLEFKEIRVSKSGILGTITFPLILLALTSGMNLFIYVGVFSFLPTFLVFKGISLDVSDLITALMLFAAMPGSVVGGSLSDKVGRRNLLIITLLLLGPFIAMGVLVSFITLIPASFLMGMTFPVMQTYAMKVGKEEEKGSTIGVVLGVGVAVSSFSPIVIGGIIDHFGFEYGFMLLAAIPLALCLALLSLPKK